MPVKKNYYDCKIANTKAIWTTHLQALSGIGSDEAIALIETHRICNKYQECGAKGLLSRCPMGNEDI